MELRGKNSLIYRSWEHIQTGKKSYLTHDDITYKDFSWYDASLITNGLDPARSKQGMFRTGWGNKGNRAADGLGRHTSDLSFAY